MKTHSKFDNNDKVYFSFMNLDYSALLDNYVYLDENQFEPHPYITTNNNFIFNTNPNNFPGHIGFGDPYCNLNVDLIHPNGIQSIPKSLIFGTEPRRCASTEIGSRDLRRKFIKSYWARDDEKYKSYLDNTDLFIIFGCSIGYTDNWWWRGIFNRLVDINNPAELIIYHYGNETNEDTRIRFLDACCLNDESKDCRELAKNNIYVVNHGENNSKISFLQID